MGFLRIEKNPVRRVSLEDTTRRYGLVHHGYGLIQLRGLIQHQFINVFFVPLNSLLGYNVTLVLMRYGFLYHNIVNTAIRL